MQIVIPIEPRTKKNSQQIIQVHGRPIIVPSRAYKEYEKACLGYIEADDRVKIDYPVNVECHYYMATKRKCDLNNLLEATTDVLVKAGVLEDDNYNIVAGHDNSRVHYDKECPRTVIKIERCKK